MACHIYCFVRVADPGPELKLTRLGLVQISAACAGPLMAVDLGGEFIKVSVVKPGRTPISIVPNEMSKRRTSAQVCTRTYPFCPQS